MTSSDISAPKSLAEAIDAVESTYELMLAYAAQGRSREEDDPLGVRASLRNCLAAIDFIAAATPDNVGAPAGSASQAVGAFLDVVRQDCIKARAAMNFVLVQPSIGSQMIDNLNASIHVRALLTDLFLLDETFEPANP